MTAGTWITIGIVLALGFAVLVLALLRAAGKASRQEELIRRCGGRANTYTPPPGATWTASRLIEGGGVRKVSVLLLALGASLTACRPGPEDTTCGYCIKQCAPFTVAGCNLTINGFDQPGKPYCACTVMKAVQP